MSKIVILCGGRGHRLKPLTSNIPKPLVVLNGKPILQHIIEFYITKGFRSFILCVGFKAEAVEKFVFSCNFDADIQISDAGEDAGILKRLYVARDLFSDKAIVTYGDTFININPYDILERHNNSKAGLTITVADIRSPFGLVEADKHDKVTFFKEKPYFSYYIGHMIIEKRILDEADPFLVSMPDGEGLVKFFQVLIGQKKINAYRHKGFKITFNTPQELENAEKEFIKFFTENIL